MARNIEEGDFEKGDKVTLKYTNSDGETVTEEKTVRMLLPEKNAIVFHFDRELAVFPTENVSGYFETKLGTFKGYNPRIVDEEEGTEEDSEQEPEESADTHNCRGCGTEVVDGEGWLQGVCDDCYKRHQEAERRMA